MKKKVTKKQKTITICSSASFYPEVILFRDKLNERGWKVFVPHSAALMERKGSFNVAAYKTWFSNPRHLKRKTWLMENHLRKIAMADSIFVVNLSKKGINGYVGGNGLRADSHEEDPGADGSLGGDEPGKVPLTGPVG